MHSETEAEASSSLDKWLSSRASLKERDIYTLCDSSTRLKKSHRITLSHTQKHWSAISHCHDLIHTCILSPISIGDKFHDSLFYGLPTGKLM